MLYQLSFSWFIVNSWNRGVARIPETSTMKSYTYDTYPHKQSVTGLLFTAMFPEKLSIFFQSSQSPESKKSNWNLKRTVSANFHDKYLIVSVFQRDVKRLRELVRTGNLLNTLHRYPGNHNCWNVKLYSCLHLGGFFVYQTLHRKCNRKSADKRDFIREMPS